MLVEVYDPGFGKATAVVFGISKFFGVYPIERNLPCSHMLNVVPILIQAVSVGYSGYLWLLGPGESPWVPSSKGWYYKILDFPPLVMALVSNSISLFIFRNRLLKVFMDLNEIERAITSVSRTVMEYTNANRGNKVLILLILMKIFNICSRENCWASIWYVDRDFDLATNLMNVLALAAIQTQFTSVVHILEDQVISLTHVFDERSRPIRDEEVEKILRLFNRIYNNCSGVNAVYSVQILAIITVNYVKVNVNAYRIVTFFNWVFDDDETHTQSFFTLLVNVMGFLQSIIVLILIVEACSSLQTAVANFNKSLYRLALDGDNQELQFNGFLSAHFSMNQMPRFTACGFFYLNYEMMYSVSLIYKHERIQQHIAGVTIRLVTRVSAVTSLCGVLLLSCTYTFAAVGRAMYTEHIRVSASNVMFIVLALQMF